MDAPTLHIELDENGAPRTINRQVKVMMIVQKHLLGNMSLPDIAEHYGIALADVYASLAYYYDNQVAMDAEMVQKEALLKEHGVSGDNLRAKIEQRLNDKSKG